MLLKEKTKNLRGYVLLGSALLFCPCHLPLLIGLLATGVGGSALAGFLSQNLSWVLAFATLYFVFALWMGQRLLTRPAACATQKAAPHGRKRDDCC